MGLGAPDQTIADAKGGPMTRIYTRSGDDGTTGLIGGQRVSKESPLMEACGSLDELNALLGVVRSYRLPEKIERALQQVQSDLFVIGAEIVTPEGTAPKGSGICDADIRNLESEIDALEDEMEPLRQFILPGGAVAAAQLHLARAVARRTERRCVAISQSAQISPRILQYLNRLSDLLFVLARYQNQQLHVPELYPSSK